MRRDAETGPVLGDGRKTYFLAAVPDQLPAILGDGGHVDLPSAIPVNGATTQDVLVLSPSIPLPDGVTGYAYCSAPGSAQIRFVNAAAAPGGNVAAGWAADTTFNVSVV
jgi:hypothetical protein